MRTELKYAAIFVALSFIWNCLEFVTGLQGIYIEYHPYFVTPFFILMTAIIYLLAIKEKRQILGGRISFLKAVLTGSILTIFILILNPFFLYIFSEFINTQFYQAFIKQDVGTGKYTLQQANEYYTLGNFIFVGTIYRFIMGMTATLIISIFIKKKIIYPVVGVATNN